MAYFCLDVEASGQLAPLFNLLSIGVTVLREDGDTHELGDSFYVELQPIFPGFDAEALAVCGLDVERLRKEGVEPRIAMQQLSDFVHQQNKGSRRKPVFVGHNAVFDWAYIAYYYAHCDMPNPFGYKGIDSKSVAMGRLGIGWEATSKPNLAKRLGLPPLDSKKVHRADYDAWYQALLFKAILEYKPA